MEYEQIKELKIIFGIAGSVVKTEYEIKMEYLVYLYCCLCRKFIPNTETVIVDIGGNEIHFRCYMTKRKTLA